MGVAVRCECDSSSRVWTRMGGLRANRSAPSPCPAGSPRRVFAPGFLAVQSGHSDFRLPWYSLTHRPYLWLEDDSCRHLRLVRRGNRPPQLDADPRFAALADEVLEHLRDDELNVPFVEVHAGWWHHFCKARRIRGQNSPHSPRRLPRQPRRLGSVVRRTRWPPPRAWTGIWRD